MPLYQYHCRRCDRQFEEFVLGGETPACPRCGARRELERLITGALAVRGGGRVAVRGATDGGGSGCAGCGGGSCRTCGR
jgi:putative FmdB family regulatory protein